MSTPPERLRVLLAGPDLVHLPGVYDAVTARLAARAGARGVCLSGAVASAVALGVPDLGFVNGSDIAARATQVTGVLDGLPVLADADTGYGNALQARRTAQTYAAAGLAGLHLEDQVAPKRCGHLAGKAVVGVAEAAGRVRAAVEAGSGLVIVARTDALSVDGVDAVVERCLAFAAAGADALFVEGAGADVIARVGAAVRAAHGREVPFVHNRSEAGGPVEQGPDDDELRALGVRLVIHPVSGLLAAARAAAASYDAIVASGHAGGTPRMDWTELTDLLDLPGQLRLEHRYADPVDAR
ncbi:isocitrate lyase/phosphoenolpyruvate mutase family protein [Nocardioides cavernae]|uniref:Isocitrate lyase/phosphoenolpyruvate mutase family protein n=1 Tax=Nocardioides cavernae TaxID=1921566 RepID=A0ABR8NHV0_9ACTN|nr:isocitrate lyase/phosphoenolpyruvate mutase family protein [Nocardioides cavernae]MBD3926730.1 isocitrate lyase/phosphoenolpyruvate mutase family protein [Nocardioides cavernae]MBM7512452.1 methylisocitrate lyase [Nocardioides cavernae]